MSIGFFKGELVIVNNGYYYEYANVETVDGSGKPEVKLNERTQLGETGVKEVLHIGIFPIVLSDLGFNFMRDALLQGYEGSCYHCNLTNGFNVKIIMESGQWKLAKESEPGKLDGFENVVTIGEVQWQLENWFHTSCVIEANKVGNMGPRLLHENVWLEQAIDLFLKGDTSSKNAAFNKLSHYLTSCVYNLDTCRYWLSEYHLDVYRNTGDKSALTEAKKHLLAAITGGCCEHFRVKLKEVENLLSL